MRRSNSLLALIDVTTLIRIERPDPGSFLSSTCTPAILLSMSCAAARSPMGQGW